MIPESVPRYKNKYTGLAVRWLAVGSCQCTCGSGLVVIYCPDNDEHDVYVMPQDAFMESYEAI